MLLTSNTLYTLHLSVLCNSLPCFEAAMCDQFQSMLARQAGTFRTFNVGRKSWNWNWMGSYRRPALVHGLHPLQQRQY